MRMRAFVAAAALTLPGLALAATPPASPTPPANPPSATPPPGSTTPPSAMPPGATPPPGANPEQAQRAQQEQILTQLVDKMNKSGDNYEMKGTIAEIDPQGGAVAIVRENKPGVILIVPPNVEIQANGKAGTIKSLQPGDQIRANFNLAQQYPIALKIVKTGSGKPPPSAPVAPGAGP